MNLTELWNIARANNISIDVDNSKSWLSSSVHYSKFTYRQSCVYLCTKGLSNSLIQCVFAHELNHVLIVGKIKEDYDHDPLRHELYAWKEALKNESIEKNSEFFELAQIQLNRYLFANERCLHDITDNVAQQEEIKRLNNESKKKIEP
jgi:hypothetical protein